MVSPSGTLVNAIVPFKWKFGVIYNLIQRAYKICSSPLHFNVEISKLRSIFSSNGYPKTFFDKVLTKFNESISGPRISNVDEIPRNFLYTFKMPFLGRPSVFLKKELSKLIKGKFGVDLNVAYTSCKIGDFFTLKSKTPFILLTNVVYKFSCLGDPSISYIGKTERHIATRMDEHLDRRAEKSAVTSHINSCVSCATHGVSYDNFSILRKCDTSYSTSIHEAFLIRRYKPLLNVQTPNQGQCVLLKIF